MNLHRRIHILWILILLGLNGCATIPGLNSQDESALPKQMLSRQILVTLPDSLKPQWTTIRTELAIQHALIETGEFPLSSIGVDCLVYKIPEQLPIKPIVTKLRSDKRIGLVQENQVFEGIQSGESDAFASLSYAAKFMHFDAAHRLATGRDVKIAIIDTGAEKEHPDLKGQIRHTANFVEGGDRSFTLDKHGTAVTGAIAARANDGVGIYGVAPDADISVFKACWYQSQNDDKAKCSSWSLAKALDAALNRGVRIINLSLAGPHDELLTKLLETAHNRGINIVTATLEAQDQPGFPASLPISVPVMSTGPDGNPPRPTWITQLKEVVAAPGQEILTTVPKEGYDFVSGSSLATAHVSGLIALLLELNPNLRPDQVKELLLFNGKSGAESSGAVLDSCAIIKALRKGEGC